jgi:hypothetical protein
MWKSCCSDTFSHQINHSRPYDARPLITLEKCSPAVGEDHFVEVSDRTEKFPLLVLHQLLDDFFVVFKIFAEMLVAVGNVPN